MILRENKKNKKKIRNVQKHAENQKRILRNVDLEICTFHIVIYFARSRRYIFCAYKNSVQIDHKGHWGENPICYFRLLKKGLSL